ncbi:hypothetical protein MADRUGA_78 [Mycobacterium phage Madruga]|uniref:Uncharacterized protein n=1 Tax=Mycobacterium phage Madruga TaxID=1675552 RepID=A0A0K1LT81_9CAUD|nr:hypothetical protein MADRUGA_78 [Mycobacterium phage Madruga]
MAHTERHMHTWLCDIPDCKEKLTAAEDHLYAVEKSWGQYEIKSFGMGSDSENYLAKTEIYLCPEHNSDLRGFLFDDRN